MPSFDTLKSFFRKPVPEASGISIFFLQKKLQRFSGDQLSVAMQRGWRKKYDSTNFYGMSIFDGEGGLLKYNAMFFPFQHFDRRVDATDFGDKEMPQWAAHNAYTSFGYKCPGGIPEGEIRDNMYCLLGLFCAELLSENTSALFFLEEHVLLRYDSSLVKRLRSGQKWNPVQLLTAQTQIDSMACDQA
jgi:hypothetical protein